MKCHVHVYYYKGLLQIIIIMIICDILMENMPTLAIQSNRWMESLLTRKTGLTACRRLSQSRESRETQNKYPQCNNKLYNDYRFENKATIEATVKVIICPNYLSKSWDQVQSQIYWKWKMKWNSLLMQML